MAFSFKTDFSFETKNGFGLAHKIINSKTLISFPFFGKVLPSVKSALQIRAGQLLITANLQPLTGHIYHAMIIVTVSFSKKSFFY